MGPQVNDGYDGYDVIGDIHGHGDRLRSLLRHMGYVVSDGAWRHPSRQAVFVGDLIDRGPSQVGCVAIARSMVEAGSARIVMGNHEFNALAYATPDPDDPTRHLRPGHLDPAPPSGSKDDRAKNYKQHRSYLDQVGGFGSELHREHLDWFRTLPLWLDLGGLRVVHAYWGDRDIDLVGPLLGPGETLTADLLVRASRKGTPEYESIEDLLKGPEVELGGDLGYLDKDGNPRLRARLRWWHTETRSLRDMALIPGGVEKTGGWPADGQLPDHGVPGDAAHPYTSDVPVIVGHYWESGVPEVLNPKVACVDYSVAKGGLLVAYRWNQGETKLTNDGFVAV